jgi:2-keto-4-pentenoate hydratase
VALSPETVAELAQALYAAEQNREPIAPLTEGYPDMEMEDAYAIQLAIIHKRTGGDSSRIAGWKVGLTSRAMQQMLGVDEPDFGHLLDDMRLEEGQILDTSGMIWPRVEPEIGFQLKADLRGPGISASDVIAATEYLMPSLEIIDSRVRDWKVKLCDTIADNASCGRFVLSRRKTPIGSVDTKLIGMNYYVDNNLVSTATSAAVIGDPAAAVAWLANTLAPLGHYLKAGQVVMPGSLVAAVDAKPGVTIRADFAGLGSIQVEVA